MNKQDAIKCLKSIQQWVPDCDDREDGLSYWDAIDMAIDALDPPNEPLTFAELREMDGPVWVACKPIEGGNGYWCLCRRGQIITPARNIFDVKEIPHWVFYRRPPEGEEDSSV